MNKSGQRLYEVGAYMLKGSLLLKAGGQKVGEAEKCFRQALDVARSQEAKSLELQVATRLAQLWQQQGKQKEAHQMLSEVYNWFTSRDLIQKDLRVGQGGVAGGTQGTLREKHWAFLRCPIDTISKDYLPFCNTASASAL